MATNNRQSEVKEYEESLLQIDRVSKVVKGGKILRFRVAVVVGDKKGHVGVGVGKAREIPSAIQKAVNDAKRNLITVPIKNNTIPLRITMKKDTAHVFLAPAVEGTGLVAGRVVRMIAEKAGIQDLLSKSIGSSNPLNVANATLEAFKQMERIIRINELRRTKEGGSNETN
ncbi:MAG: 30S ribosomal protein S5 [Caldisericaceae bacterium]